MTCMSLYLFIINISNYCKEFEWRRGPRSFSCRGLSESVAGGTSTDERTKIVVPKDTGRKQETGLS